MMTNPHRYLIRMLVFLLMVGAIAGLLYAPLFHAFMGNPALNGVILGALLLGIIYSFRQILRLDPERRWLMNVQKSGKLDSRQVKPVLLATVYGMLADQRQESQLSALSLRSVLVLVRDVARASRVYEQALRLPRVSPAGEEFAEFSLWRLFACILCFSSFNFFKRTS